jgi:predicted O-linked N-acetylglucosamine transferase (SPINDLY family)
MAEDPFQAAVALHREGRLDQAEAGYRRVLRASPLHPGANNNLAILLRGLGRLEEAVARYRTALRSAAEDGQIHNNLSCVLTALGRDAEAEAAITAALRLQPAYGEAWFNLGNARKAAGQGAQAAGAYQRALVCNPALAEAHSNLGDLFKEAGEYGRAEACYRTAMRLRPELPQPWVNLGEMLREQGRIQEALTVMQDGLDRHPQQSVLHSNLLLTLHYTPWIPPEVVYRAHRFWEECHALSLAPEPHRFTGRRQGGRALRVGYVSPDFCAHACASFSLPLLRRHDRDAVHVLCYASGPREDDVSEAFRSAAQDWRSIARLDDAAAAALIERDEVDILVDLAGHTGQGRPLLFARRPAPVQVTWLGYPDSTGMAAVDYRLTDAIADPEGVADRWHAERLVRLADGFLTFEPLAAESASPALPAAGRGHVTFGSFNSAAKITPEMVRLWSALLRRVPGARLVLKNAALRDRDVRDRLARLFAQAGVADDRLTLLGPVGSPAGHLRAYDGIDIALDTFPYNGTTTTCEALWMGVPVVTLAGRQHVSRVGASLLARCGLADLVAADEAGYLDAAAALAEDPRLGALRRGMPERLQASSLTRHGDFARAVEAAYRRMWQRWLDGQAGPPWI